MAVDEQLWQQAVLALRRAIGDDEASALIDRFLDEPARRDDLHGVEERLDARIGGVEERLDARVTGVEHRLGERIEATRELLDERIASVDRRVGSLAQVLGERLTGLQDRDRERTARLEEKIDRRSAELTATMRGELNRQLQSLLLGFVGLQVAIGGFVVALFRFGV